MITYVARNLEPYRGFHIFMRAVQVICQRRKDYHIVIVGGDEVSYGRVTKGRTYKQQMLEEVTLDHSRVHFMGKLPYADYLKVLQISSAHVYLTVPFVLSWSCLEAMATGCVVIGSNTPPVQEVIENNKTGLLVDFFSPTEIADAVDRALDHANELKPLRATARKFVCEHYPISRSIRQYEHLLKQLL